MEFVWNFVEICLIGPYKSCEKFMRGNHPWPWARDPEADASFEATARKYRGEIAGPYEQLDLANDWLIYLKYAVFKAINFKHPAKEKNGKNLLVLW